MCGYSDLRDELGDGFAEPLLRCGILDGMVRPGNEPGGGMDLRAGFLPGLDQGADLYALRGMFFLLGVKDECGLLEAAPKVIDLCLVEVGGEVVIVTP